MKFANCLLAFFLVIALAIPRDDACRIAKETYLASVHRSIIEQRQIIIFITKEEVAECFRMIKSPGVIVYESGSDEFLLEVFDPFTK